VSAQTAAPARGQGRGANQGRIPPVDRAAAERGQATFTANCGFCHGANAKGGEGGPDLIRSVVVLDDEGGKEIGEIVKAGRQDQGMPKFSLTDAQISDIAAFLHQRVNDAAFRQTYQLQDILVGDAKAGEAYFNGAGGCAKCHSISGDFQRLGAKYDTAALQDRIVMPRAGRTPNNEQPRLATTATVTVAPGKSYTGTLVRMTDFDVTIRDDSKNVRTFTRVSDTNPKIERHEPLEGHIDMLPKWKDSDLHNVTAYLVTLK
jgi:mono/diheme cytochrome c family protein